MIPPWILQCEDLQPPPRAMPLPVPSVERRRVVRPAGVRWDSQEVLDAIPDKVALARSWGLRIASHRENAAGWFQCHAIDREDRTPSASFSASRGGRYWEPGERSIGLFALSVRLGVYASYGDAVHDLGMRFCSRRVRSA